MKIAFISDTHSKHTEVTLPQADMLIHAGDISSRGRPAEVREFLNWFSALPYSHKIFVGGNHDFMLERNEKEFLSMLPDDCTYLRNEGITVEGIHIWGSPVTPWFYDWAFNRRRGSDIKRYWDRIPSETDILITHGPPYGILDKTARGDHAGCEELMDAIKRVAPDIHVFGHIHEAYGREEHLGTLFLNASVLDLSYSMTHEPHVIEW